MRPTTNKIADLKLSKPAHMALVNGGITTLKQLSKFSEKEILKLHGIGKTAIPVIKQALKANGLSIAGKIKRSAVKKVQVSVDDYLNSLPADIKSALGMLRNAIRNAAPKAEEKISYSLPFYRQNGHLAAFVSQKNHLSFVTMSKSVIKKFKVELKSFKVSGTTIQFQPDKPIPAALVKKIIKSRLKENEERIIKTKK